MGIIYIMANIPFFWKCKIGITRKRIGQRRKSVSHTTPGFVFPIFFMVLPWGTARLESDLHRVFRPFAAPFSQKKASGRTEWFVFLPVAPLAVIFILLTACIYWAPVALAVWWLISKA